MELSNAFSTSAEAFLLSKHMAYSITTASQGNMILPSLVKPNSSCDILRSSLKTAVPRQCDPSIACEAELLLRDPEELCEDRRGEERQRDLEPPPIGGVHDAMALHCHRTAAFIGCFGRRPSKYGNGTSNRAPSAVYTAQWPLPARDRDAVLQQSSAATTAFCRLPPTYSITDASHGNVILPSSSPKTIVPRYGSGTSNRAPSAVYTVQWPLPAREDVLQQSSVALDHMTYSITDASHVNVILPSSPAKPNSS
uniref:Uncharacterized protein n=1 Tax=Oryza glumipatula TaxID=40148 RepID=A0A0E0B625_9ORYZ